MPAQNMPKEIISLQKVRDIKIPIFVASHEKSNLYIYFYTIVLDSAQWVMCTVRIYVRHSYKDTEQNYVI